MDESSVPVVAGPVLVSGASSVKAFATDRLPELVGNADLMLDVSRRIRLVAPRSTPVLIEGPTGSGKELVAEGLVDGLRIDHIDGLLDPKAYCLKLRASAPRPLYIVAEKILAADEALPADWGLDGTTGYEFAAMVNPLLVDPAAEAVLSEFHRRLTGAATDPAEIEYAAKLAVMESELAAELANLGLL